MRSSVNLVFGLLTTALTSAYPTATGAPPHIESRGLLGGVVNLLSSLTTASTSDPRFTDWQAPGPDDVRSPCPGLNTLANHGFIHRDGKNMTLPHLILGLSDALNVGADFTILAGAVGLLSSPNPEEGAFDLDMLDQHNFPIEHDASLSRSDAYFGNDYTFNETIFNQTMSYYGDDEFTSINTSSQARYARYLDSQSQNPEFVFGLKERLLAYGETAVYLQTMSDPSTNGVAKVEYIRELFENERLPWDLGWRPSKYPITLLTLRAQITELFLAGPEPFTQGVEIGADSYQDVLTSIVGETEVLGNLTQGLSSAIGL